MLLELLRFLGGAIVLIVPGVLFAFARRMGRDWLEKLIHGSCLGLAAAVYLACLVSRVELHWFYLLWVIVGLITLIYFFKSSPGSQSVDSETSIRRWMILLLLLVAASRYAVTLPQELPDGWDPSFHAILARKIQLTDHSISDWLPFESVPLNYPTGGHTLVAVLSTITGLPVHLTFKDLIPLLGILTTGQIFLLARNVTGRATASLYAALIYGFWSDFGSIGYYRWGGLPNEMAMLFFLAMLTVWLEKWPSASRLPAMSLLFASAVLVHHHVMLTSAAIVAALFIAPVKLDRRTLALAAIAAAVLDSFFLVPYAARISTLASTHVLHSGELPVSLFRYLLPSMGYLFLAASALGIAVSIRRRRESPIHPVAGIALVTLIAFYCICEYVWPLFKGSTFLTPSRFPTDMSAFLAIFAGIAAEFAQKEFRLARAISVVAMLLMSLVLIPAWMVEMRGSETLPDFLAACDWIQRNTDPNAYVICDRPITDYGQQFSWIPYLTWRRAAYVPLPDSEAIDRIPRPGDRILALMSGNGSGSSPVVAILSPDDPTSFPVLWRGPNGLRVVRVWPRP